MSKFIQIFLIFFFIEEYKFRSTFLLLTFFDNINFKSLYFLKWCPIFDSSNSQSSIISFDYSWFLAKKLSTFLSLTWKRPSRYCPTSNSASGSSRGKASLRICVALQRTSLLATFRYRHSKGSHKLCNIFWAFLLFFDEWKGIRTPNNGSKILVFLLAKTQWYI